MKPLLSLAYHGTYKSIDKGVLEVITVRSIFNVITQLMKSIGALQSGYIFNYVMLSFCCVRCSVFHNIFIIKKKNHERKPNKSKI